MDQLKIKEAVSVLRRGGTVIYPTDTIYGIGVDATNEQAVKHLLELKHRSPAKGLSLMVGSFAAIERMVQLSSKTKTMLRDKLPGPYTFVLPYIHIQAIASSCIYNNTIAIRMPNHPVALELAHAFGKPITATSANLAGKPPLSSLKSLKSLGADYVLWVGKLPESLPSTVVDLTQKKPRLRRGGAGQWP